MKRRNPDNFSPYKREPALPGLKKSNLSPAYLASKGAKFLGNSKKWTGGVYMPSKLYSLPSGAVFHLVEWRDGKNDQFRSSRRVAKNPAGGTLAAARRQDAAVDKAAKLYESFHGSKASKLTRRELDIAVRTTVAPLGLLRWLHVQSAAGLVKVAWSDSEAPTLETSPDGRTLFVSGGKQALELARFGAAKGADLVPLGQVVKIAYLTRKGFHNFAPTEYRHPFGTVGGRPDLVQPWQRQVKREARRPWLLYDSLNESLLIAGGAFRVAREGIIF